MGKALAERTVQDGPPVYLRVRRSAGDKLSKSRKCKTQGAPITKVAVRLEQIWSGKWLVDRASGPRTEYLYLLGPRYKPALSTTELVQRNLQYLLRCFV